MKNILPVVLLLALSSVPALAERVQNDQGENNDDQGGKGRTRGAPGPIMGASLPGFSCRRHLLACPPEKRGRADYRPIEIKTTTGFRSNQ